MAGRDGYRQTDGVLIARLDGSAHRLAGSEVPVEDAVAELRAITIRVDLLSQAAGGHMGRYRHRPSANPYARAAADLLLAAGADLEQSREYAEIVVNRLQVRSAD